MPQSHLSKAKRYFPGPPALFQCNSTKLQARLTQNKPLHSLFCPPHEIYNFALTVLVCSFTEVLSFQAT